VNEDMTPREQFALMKKMAARILDLEVKVQELQKEVKGDEVEAVKLPLNQRRSKNPRERQSRRDRPPDKRILR
jgi:hypothetical protein